MLAHGWADLALNDGRGDCFVVGVEGTAAAIQRVGRGGWVQLAPPVAAANDLPLWIGGPVEPERGWILLSEARDHDEARELVPGLFLSASPDVLRRPAPAPRENRSKMRSRCSGNMSCDTSWCRRATAFT